jgi:uncharacterized membrane protein
VELYSHNVPGTSAPVAALRQAGTIAPRGGTDRYRGAKSVEELTEHNVEAIHRLENEAQRSVSALDAVADRVSAFCGSTPFLWAHVIWFAAWIGGNVILGARAFDPYPFTFLTLVVSLEAIFLSSFLLISQNHASHVSERRNQLDLQFNLHSEQENTKMLEMLQRIARAVGVTDHGDPSLDVLEQATRPDQLAEQIDRAAHEDAPKGAPPTAPR